MILLRSLIYFLAMVLSVVVATIAIWICRPFLPFPRLSRLANAWGLSNLWLLKHICKLDYEMHGGEHLRQEGGYIVLAKHQSTWETLSLRGLLPPPQTWVLKRELLWVPFFGWALIPFHPIAIDRKAGRRAIRQVIEEGEAALRDGRIVVIFPEGTRVAPGTKGHYGMGGALLAEKSGCPVIPVAHNAGVFWHRRGLLKYPGTIQLEIGEPIETRGLKAKEINRRVEEWIESRVAAMPQSPNS